MPVFCSLCGDSCSSRCHESHRHKFACHNKHCSLYKPDEFERVGDTIYHTSEHSSSSSHRPPPRSPERESYSGRPRPENDRRRDSYVDPHHTPRPSKRDSHHESDRRSRRDSSGNFFDKVNDAFFNMGIDDDLAPRRGGGGRRDSFRQRDGYEPFEGTPSSSRRDSRYEQHDGYRSSRPDCSSYHGDGRPSSSGHGRASRDRDDDGYAYSPRGSRYEDGHGEYFPSSSSGDNRPSGGRGREEEIDEQTGLPICTEYVYHSTEEPDGEVIDKGPAYGMSSEQAYEYAWGRRGGRYDHRY